MIRKLLVLVLFLGFLQMIEDTKKIGTGEKQEETQQKGEKENDQKTVGDTDRK